MLALVPHRLVINYEEGRLAPAAPARPPLAPGNGTFWTGSASRVMALQLALDLQAQFGLTPVQLSRSQACMSPATLPPFALVPFGARRDPDRFSDGSSNQTVCMSDEHRGHK